MSTSNDPLAEINGVKPLRLLADEETVDVKSKTSKSVYKVKRTLDHYYCTCPAWRMQARVRVESRSCKHIREVLGDAYEDARNAAAAGDNADDDDVTKDAKKGKGKAKAEGTKPVSRSTRATTITASSSKPEDDGERKDEVKKENGEDSTEEAMNIDGDVLTFGGVKPDRILADGESVEVSSHTSNAKYKIKRTWDHYNCSCPAWRNQPRAPVNARTCKHIRLLLGDAYENARIKSQNPDADIADVKPKLKRGTKRKAEDDDDDEDDDVDTSPRKRAKNGSVVAKVKAPDLLLAVKWDLEKGIDPTGWWVSEKLDGVRVFYDGKKRTMVSRLGNAFTPPDWFIEGLPKDVTLDGELFGGRGQFQTTVSVVKTRNSPRWSEITFQVFDVPSMGAKSFEERLEYLHATFTKRETEQGSETESETKHVIVVEQTQAESREHVMDMLTDVEGKGGEGLMLRKPGSLYEGKRSSTLQKIKTFHDAEARVEGYAPGKGKHKNSTGALKCVMASGKTFNVGTGLSDKQRRNPPKIGSIIVYRFQELTPDGVPRFPAFVGEAIDKTEPKDAEIPEQRRAGAKKAGTNDDI